MSELQMKMNSKIGPLYLVASAKGLQGVFWKQRPVDFYSGHSDSSKKDGMRKNSLAVNNLEAVKHLQRAEKQIEEYLSGQRKSFDLVLDIQGTDFQKRVWQELSKIPYGTTYSYKQLAIKVENQKACRAVGTANGRNPLSLIVPCHRVIASDGTLGGYAGGLPIKEKLLRLELTGAL
jgi:methylated-DNA-[protein]-cysteine S-methyltransferase